MSWLRMMPFMRPQDPKPYQRRSDGLWVAPWYDETGKRRFAYAKDVEQALNKRKRAKRGYDDHQTLGEFLSWWVESFIPRRVEMGKLAHSTAEEYAANLRRYVHPHRIADVKITKLSPQHFDDWLADLTVTVSGKTGRRLSGRTIQYAHATVRAALQTARRYRLIEDNPAALVEAPSPDTGEAAFLTPAQVPVFLRACEGDRFEALWKVVLPIGLRIGEALAITLDDVDLDAGTIRVAHSIGRARIGGETVWLRKATKTHAEATLELPRFALDAVRRRLEVRDLEKMMAGDLWADAAVVDERGRGSTVELLFCRRDGGPTWHSTAGRELAALCERAGLPRLTAHSLRHATASILVAQGAQLTDVQKLLRHRQGRLTSDLYTHLVGEVQRDHVRRMDGLADG